MTSKKSTLIHPTAVVSPEASIAEGVEIGPYSVLGPQVKIGKGTRISNYVTIEGDVEIGARCRLFPGACIGGAAQTRASEPVRSSVVIGDDNVVREYVTIHQAMKEGSKTVIGHRNFLMAHAHVAHDCVLGSDIVIANNTALGGHVQIEDRAVIGGLVGVHQFVRIGRLSIVGGLSKVVMDVAPYSIYDGHPAKFHGLNSVGLKRAGYTSAQMAEIKKALKMLFAERVNLSKAVLLVRSRFKSNSDVQAILAFIERSKRGVGRTHVAV